MTRIYDEIVDFIAAGSTPGAVASFEPSPESRRRAIELLERERDGVLSDEEQEELHHFAELEHIMRLAKARARRHL